MLMLRLVLISLRFALSLKVIFHTWGVEFYQCSAEDDTTSKATVRKSIEILV